MPLRSLGKTPERMRLAFFRASHCAYCWADGRLLSIYPGHEDSEQRSGEAPNADCGAYIVRTSAATTPAMTASLLPRFAEFALPGGATSTPIRLTYAWMCTTTAFHLDGSVPRCASNASHEGNFHTTTTDARGSWGTAGRNSLINILPDKVQFLFSLTSSFLQVFAGRSRLTATDSWFSSSMLMSADRGKMPYPMPRRVRRRRGLCPVSPSL